MNYYNVVMTYNNELRSNRSNENKRRITECAMQLISEKGFDAVSVSEITEAAGVSKGSFYTHFSSKEDLIEQKIRISYEDALLSADHSRFERLEYFLTKSLEHIKNGGLKMAQVWFSHSVQGSFYGKSKLDYDRARISDILGDKRLADEVVSVYYGALNLWCFTDGEVEPEKIIMDHIRKYKEHK